MYYLEVISLILFVVSMIIGYKKNNRNIMLASFLCLLLGLAGPDFISGFKKGYSETVKVS